MVKQAEHLNDQWQNELKKFRYNANRFQTKEDKLNFWDEESKNYDERMFQDPRRIVAVREILQKNGVLNDETTILELGCGTGLYSIDLAKHCKEVQAIDLSEKMGEVVLRKAREEHLTNVAFEQADWNEVDIKQAGLYKNFDLTISALNPAMSHLNAIRKMCDTSTQACCIVTFAGEIQNNVHSYLTEGKVNERNDASWTFYIEEILKALHYEPTVTMIEMKWVKRHQEQEAIQRLLKEYAHLIRENASIEQVENYVKSNLDEEGFFSEHNVTPLSIIYWEV